MPHVQRKVTYRLYPTARQEAALLKLKSAHQQLYNAALEQRISAYRLCGTSVTYAMQCRDLTELRAAEPEYWAINAQSEQVTLKRIDLAFAAFFRRVAAGQTPGFPRFRSLDRFSGFGYKAHGDGWKLIPGSQRAHGKIRLSGVGEIRVRGRARTPGVPVTCEIQHKRDRWYASVTVNCSPERERGTRAVGLDWGVTTFATLVEPSGETYEIGNPRFTRSSAGVLAEARASLARKRRDSKNRKKARRIVAKVHARTANRRTDFLHKTTAAIVADSALIATERLEIKAMTARGGRRKAGLNREILSTAPGTFLRMLQTKAEEAGVEFVEVPTRRVKPSQTCPGCGRQRKKALSERVHSCECGLTLGRDVASALVCVQWALTGSAHGREPSRLWGGDGLALKQETHAVRSLGGRG